MTTPITPEETMAEMVLTIIRTAEAEVKETSCQTIMDLRPANPTSVILRPLLPGELLTLLLIIGATPCSVSLIHNQSLIGEVLMQPNPTVVFPPSCLLIKSPRI